MVTRTAAEFRSRLSSLVWRHVLRISEPFSQLALQVLPKGLYARALLIILVPIVLLQSVLAFVFLERHWNQVTRRLSEATARDIAAVVELFETTEFATDQSKLIDFAQNKLALTSLQILPPGELPSKEPRPFLGLLDRALSEEIRNQVKREAWIDTVGQSQHVEIRIKLDNATLRFVAPRGQIYASNSHIFLVWMLGTSLVLVSAAVLQHSRPWNLASARKPISSHTGSCIYLARRLFISELF